MNMSVTMRAPPDRMQTSTSSSESSLDGVGSVADFLPNEPWRSEGLAIVVVGASGDLAKKKIYPSLLQLYKDGLLPDDTIIWGYARTAMAHADLRQRLRPHLAVNDSPLEIMVDRFLEICFYTKGNSYGDISAYRNVVEQISEHERSFPTKIRHNRLLYLAIPPNVFGETGMALKHTAMATRGWTRLVIEKPFGRDLESCQALIHQLGKEFEEHNLYRIDHYLGKEVVQNLITLRFSNTWLEHIWNQNAVSAVHIAFKEPFGTMGRGGYFDASGIIRDILQNHLLQVLTLVAMEPPTSLQGNDIRDRKVEVLESMSTLKNEDCLLGQYEGYTDDDTIQNNDTNTPTYAAVQCRVNTPRWEGVPFVIEAGKALDERICQVRIQFHPVPGLPRNELVLRLQPDPAIYMRTNVKTPGFATSPTQVSLGMEYNAEFDFQRNNPGAYTRLLLDVMRGRQGSFVRNDELEKSWTIFTPLLHNIERENIRPLLYKQGSTGPVERADFMKRVGVSEDGVHDGSHVPQSFL